MSVATTSLSRLTDAFGAGIAFRWTGQPAQGLLFRTADIFLVPFTLLWFGFAAAGMGTLLFSSSPIAAKLPAIPFLAIGLYIAFGRFAVDAYSRAHTSYGVGENAAYIVRDGFGRRSIMINASALAPIEMNVRGNGTGTISFGPRPPFSRSVGWNMFGFDNSATFERIPDVRNVYQLVEVIALQR